MRKRIIQTFEQYGYIIVDACEPEDEDLLKDIKTFNLEFINMGSSFNCPEYKIQGFRMDIEDILNLHWGESEEYLEGFVNISKGEK